MQKNVWGYFRCPNGSDKEKGTDMKEMIKKMREERGGFTLAELLVVVAIVAVLVAIAVPLFSSSLTSAEEAVKKANERSVKAEVTTLYLTGTDEQKASLNGSIYYANEKGDLTGPAASDGSGKPDDAKYTYEVTVTPDANGGAPTIKVEEKGSGAASGN